jgi:hypothetical protein
MACALSTAIHFAAATPAVGQIATAMPDSGFVQSRAVERGRVDWECVRSLGPSFLAEIRNSTCRVIEVVDLGTTGSVLWAAARYIRSGTSDFIQPGDSVLLDETVLFSRAAADSLLVPRWRLTKDRTYDFITSVNGTGTPD